MIPCYGVLLSPNAALKNIDSQQIEGGFVQTADWKRFRLSCKRSEQTRKVEGHEDGNQFLISVRGLVREAD